MARNEFLLFECNCFSKHLNSIDYAVKSNIFQCHLKSNVFHLKFFAFKFLTETSFNNIHLNSTTLFCVVYLNNNVHELCKVE